ncbi:hypothetical protein ABFA07_011620 [Porites harrisoni]
MLPCFMWICQSKRTRVRKWKRKISKLDKDIRDKTSATLNRTKQGKRTLNPNIVSHLTEKRNLSELLFCEIKLDCKNKALNVEQKDWTLKSSE